MEVKVLQPSGACFTIKMDKLETCGALKIAIATQTRVQHEVGNRMFFSGRCFNWKRLEEVTSEASVEVLLVVSPVCDLVTHPGVTPGIWDCDACTLEHPVIVKDDDLAVQEVEDAMRLEDSSSLKAR
eukprot:s659_g4.t1